MPSVSCTTVASLGEARPVQVSLGLDEQLQGLYDGVVMTETVLNKAFEEHGMKRLWPIDEKFDPNIHNALFEAPDPSREAGTIMHVASAGYVLHERVIRAAGVGVVRKD